MGYQVLAFVFACVSSIAKNLGNIISHRELEWRVRCLIAKLFKLRLESIQNFAEVHYQDAFSPLYESYLHFAKQLSQVSADAFFLFSIKLAKPFIFTLFIQYSKNVDLFVMRHQRRGKRIQ